MGRGTGMEGPGGRAVRFEMDDETAFMVLGKSRVRSRGVCVEKGGEVSCGGSSINE
jgi:hypothetical protein